MTGRRPWRSTAADEAAAGPKAKRPPRTAKEPAAKAAKAGKPADKAAKPAKADDSAGGGEKPARAVKKAAAKKSDSKTMAKTAKKKKSK